MLPCCYLVLFNIIYFIFREIMIFEIILEKKHAWVYQNISSQCFFSISLRKFCNVFSEYRKKNLTGNGLKSHNYELFICHVYWTNPYHNLDKSVWRRKSRNLLGSNPYSMNILIHDSPFKAYSGTLWPNGWKKNIKIMQCLLHRNVFDHCHF